MISTFFSARWSSLFFSSTSVVVGGTSSDSSGNSLPGFRIAFSAMEWLTVKLTGSGGAMKLILRLFSGDTFFWDAVGPVVLNVVSSSESIGIGVAWFESKESRNRISRDSFRSIGVVTISRDSTVSMISVGSAASA